MKIRDLFAAEDRSAIEKYCRQHTQQAYLGDHTALCRVLGQFLMYVDTRDLSLAPHLLMNGYWEMWVTQAIVDYVKPGMRCIDVGANFGYFALLLAELAGDKGEVIACEPQKRVFDLLVSSTVVNGAMVRPIWAAISDLPGQAQLYVHDLMLGSASLGVFEGAYQQASTVPVLTLDEFVRTPVDFVKIDVQGHEMNVLWGMEEVIKRSPKIAIAMEFTPAEHEDPLAALKEIQSYDLSIRTIGTDGQVRPIKLEDAAKADTGDHRMLWLSKG